MKQLFFISLIFCALSTTAQKFNERALIQNLKILSADSMAGRRTGTPGNAMARSFIKAQFKLLKLEPLGNDYEMPFTFERRGESVAGINIVGTIPAKTKTDRFIVISAHYDHLGVREEKIYNGTDDNASGTSALISVAEYFKKHNPQHNIIVVAFDAEEMGLQGARAFVKSPPVPIEKIVLNVNMDMVARADKKELVACGTYYYPPLKSLLENIVPIEGVKLVFGHDNPDLFQGSNNWTQSSDHGPFHDLKIPFIYFGVEDHADYHKATDDFDKVNTETYINCVRLILRSIIALDAGVKQ
jgi:Zn-dependent M28 family amino/carboxypeptidase